jgi:hypothetical protein
MDRLLHWVLLNTHIRKQVEAALDTCITHSTETDELPDEDKVSRQLKTMNIMERLGYTSKLSVWREAGTLMEGTHVLQVQGQAGQVGREGTCACCFPSCFLLPYLYPLPFVHILGRPALQEGGKSLGMWTPNYCTTHAGPQDCVCEQLRE